MRPRGRSTAKKGCQSRCRIRAPREALDARDTARWRLGRIPRPDPRRSFGPGAREPRHREEDRRAPRADDARGEGRPAQPVQQRLRRDRPAAERRARRRSMYDQIRTGAGRLDAERHRRRGDAQGAAARGREQPAQDPADLRPRRDPRLPDDLPDPARRGGQLGPGGDRAVGAHRARPRRPRRASTGRSRRWWTSRATRAGAGSWKAPARTRTSARRRPRRACAASRGRTWRRSTRSRPARSTTPPTASPRPGRDYNTVDISEQTLRNVVLPPFKAAADAGAATFMNSFNEIARHPVDRQRAPAARHPEGRVGLPGLRRVRLGLDRRDGPRTASPRTSRTPPSRRSPPAATWTWRRGPTSRHLAALVKAGKVDVKLVDDAVRRVLRVKFALGLFDDPYRYSDAAPREAGARGTRPTPRPRATWRASRSCC